MRDPQRIVRLIATLVFGISVLALFSLVLAQMATHYFQGAAERTIRRAFTEDSQTKDGVHYDSVCRRSDTDRTRLSECDPIVVKAERSLRSASCTRFTDGAILRVNVSLGIGRRRLEIVLPFREPGTMRGAASDRFRTR
jgi:hypothetical protein